MTAPKLGKKVTNAEPKTASDTDPLSSLRTKLKAADPEIRNYVVALEAENLKLQRQVAALQADNVSKDNRIKALEEQPINQKVRFAFGKKDSHKMKPPK